jgi:hypothetical protein
MQEFTLYYLENNIFFNNRGTAVYSATAATERRSPKNPKWTDATVVAIAGDGYDSVRRALVAQTEEIHPYAEPPSPQSPPLDAAAAQPEQRRKRSGGLAGPCSVWLHRRREWRFYPAHPIVSLGRPPNLGNLV